MEEDVKGLNSFYGGKSMKDKNKSQLIIYQTESGETKIDVRFQNETVWLSQQLLAELFQTTKQNVSLHIGNIYEARELVPQATVKKFLTVRKEGGREVQRKVEYYDLDMIISVGYCIKSKVGEEMKVAVYTRVSTEEQAKEGYFLEVQRKYLESFAEHAGYERERDCFVASLRWVGVSSPGSKVEVNRND